MDIPQKQAKLNLANTPRGSNFYASTPGGTRTVYSKADLLSLASSPLSKTPPTGLSNFPAAMSRDGEGELKQKHKPQHKQAQANKPDGNTNNHSQETTFEMDDD
ncbi:hypothetical protein E3P86_01086 [Wallemia ichthyophaga]|uniref:Eukaryotic translation initiation factor 4E-binding protein 1 n=1 Tax=Wallemia ichthyophaga TaxID=245174 RepID=A0A4T0JCK9_WALIC|nr:hypothetical protein E3P86_01086 [Wallemia ichthyophaga]